jgi:hypothetical protein
MQILWIIGGIIVLAYLADRVFRISDKWRAKRKAAAAARNEQLIGEAREYLRAHELLSVTITQASEWYALQAQMVKAKLARAYKSADVQQIVAARNNASAFNDACSDLIEEVVVAISYDHVHFKKLPDSFQKSLADRHEQWHAHDVALRGVRADVAAFALGIT